MSGQVLLERSGRTSCITIDRPKAKGALTSDMVDALADIVYRLRTADDVDVVVIRGTGSDFCAGSDMGDIAAVLEASPPDRHVAFEAGITGTVQPLLRDLLGLRQPIVACVRGHAIGIGVMFMLAADLVVASETTSVSLPQPHLGHSLDHGESWLLPRRIGPSRAMQMCLSGNPVNAADLDRFGMINWLTTDDELDHRTEQVVDGLLAVAPQSLWRTKALLTRSAGSSFDEQLVAESEHASAGAATEDFVEAISARMQRRVPAYTGR